MTTAQQYAEQVIKTNLQLGFTFEEIAADMKAAAQRHLKNEMAFYNNLEEYANTSHGFASLKNQMGVNS